MNGLQLACIYSFGCPELEVSERTSLVSDFIDNPGTGKTNNRRVKSVLKTLGPFLFYWLIALSTGRRKVFSEDVVRAYWLGSSILRPIEPAHVQVILKRSDIIKNFNPAYLAKLRVLIGGKPNHNFEVLQILSEAMGSKSGFPPGFLTDAVNCLVLPAKVLRVNREILISLPRPVIRGRTLSLSSTHLEMEKGFVGDVAPGDFVSLHLGICRETISKEQAMNLLKLTREAVNFFNKKRVN